MLRTAKLLAIIALAKLRRLESLTVANSVAMLVCGFKKVVKFPSSVVKSPEFL